MGDGNEGSLQGVLKSLGRTGRGSVGIGDTSQLQETLDGGRSDQAGTTGSRNETDGDGTALSALLGGEGVRLTEVGTPVTSSDGDDGELGDDDGGADGSCDFLGGLDTETNVTLGVTDDNDGLEAGTLTGTGLLLDGLDLHDLVLELGKEEVDDLVLLDGERVEVAACCQPKFFTSSVVLVNVHLLHALDLASLHETAELGDGLPFLLLYQLSISCNNPFSDYMCVLQTFRHGGHGHVRDHVHGHHRGLHENRIRRERGQERQPFCMSGGVYGC